MTYACDCSFDTSLCDGPEFCNEREVVARKQHYCCECGETIEPGQRYERVAGKWNGGIETYCTCLTCQRIRLDYCPGGWWYGGLRETISECLGIDYLEADDDDDEVTND